MNGYFPLGLNLFHLGQEDHLEKEMATHSSILAWEITWTEEPGGVVCTVCGITKESDTTEQLNNNSSDFQAPLILSPSLSPNLPALRNSCLHICIPLNLPGPR